jgi:hypothetical protein
MCQAMHLRSPAGIQAWGGTRLRRLDGFTQFLEPVLDGGIKQHLSATRIRVIAKFGRALPELLPAPAVWIIPTCAPSGGLRRIPASTAYLAQRSWGYLWRGVRGAAPSTRVRNTGRTHAPCGCDCAEAAPSGTLCADTPWRMAPAWHAVTGARSAKQSVESPLA